MRIKSREATNGQAPWKRRGLQDQTRQWSQCQWGRGGVLSAGPHTWPSSVVQPALPPIQASSRRPIATRTVSSSIRSPGAETGRALSHAPDSRICAARR